MSVDNLMSKINAYVIDPIILLLFALAFAMFFWGLAQFILNAGSEDGRTKGKRHMFWGIIGIFVMFGVYGILGILGGTFGFSLP